MAFTQQQTRKLKAKLSSDAIKTRESDGRTLSYIEGWHAIAEANRIFGYDAWDRETVIAECIWSGERQNKHACVYRAKVRISVRAGDMIVTREGSGTSEGHGATLGEAHDIALKAAETDATKRALATFGNLFGLALYDKEQNGVRRPNGRSRLWMLRSDKGIFLKRYTYPHDFAKGLLQALDEAPDVETLFAIWEHNVQTVRVIKSTEGAQDKLAERLVAGFKARAVAIAKLGKPGKAPPNGGAGYQVGQPVSVQSAFPLEKPKRIRSKDHLRFVAQQPCLVCGRTPSHAHHIRFAQPKALGLKVSDEFTVPLCAIHHDQLHRTGDERQWWQDRQIEPLAAAKELWRRSSANATEGRQPPGLST